MFVLNKCKKCPPDIKGLCCFHTVLIYGESYILPKNPCKFYNKESKGCTEYRKRYKKNDNCQPIQRARKLRVLPEGCLYLKKRHIKKNMFKKFAEEPLPDDVGRIYDRFNQKDIQYD